MSNRAEDVEGFWWSDPWFWLKNERVLRVYPSSLRLNDAEAVNRISLLLAYILGGAWLLTSDTAWLVYLTAGLVLIYAGHSYGRRVAVAGPAARRAPPGGPSRNVRPYRARLAAGLLSHRGEFEPRHPIEASKQRKAFARVMPMTGDEVPFPRMYENGGGRWNRLRPVGPS